MSSISTDSCSTYYYINRLFRLIVTALLKKPMYYHKHVQHDYKPMLILKQLELNPFSPLIDISPSLRPYPFLASCNVIIYAVIYQSPTVHVFDLDGCSLSMDIITI